MLAGVGGTCWNIETGVERGVEEEERGVDADRDEREVDAEGEGDTTDCWRIWPNPNAGAQAGVAGVLATLPFVVVVGVVGLAGRLANGVNLRGAGEEQVVVVEEGVKGVTGVHGVQGVETVEAGVKGVRGVAEEGVEEEAKSRWGMLSDGECPLFGWGPTLREAAGKRVALPGILLPSLCTPELCVEMEEILAVWSDAQLSR